LVTRLRSLVIRAVGDLVRYAVRSSVLPFVGSLLLLTVILVVWLLLFCVVCWFCVVCYAVTFDCGYVGYAVTVWLRWTRYCVVVSLLRWFGPLLRCVFVYVVAPPLFVGLVVDCAVTLLLTLFYVRAVVVRT
jgi:hypothetical protein